MVCGCGCGGLNNRVVVPKYETGDTCESIDSYTLTAVTKQEESFFRTYKKVKGVVEYAETLQDQDEIVWTDKEVVIELHDTIVEVDDWELILVSEEYDEYPQVTAEIYEDITYESKRISCDSVEPFEIEEQVWKCTENLKTVALNTKVESMETKEYLMSDLEQID